MPTAVPGRAARPVPLLAAPLPSLLLLLLLPLSPACDDPVDSGPNRDAAPDLERDAGPDLAPGDAAWLRPDGRLNTGQACSTDWDCAAGLSCDTKLPGGMCTADCKTDADCKGPAEACHEGRCHLRCNPRAPLNPCRDKYVCLLEGTQGSCVPDCRDRSCAKAGWICDANSGLCVDPSSGTLGAPCGVKEGGCDGTPNGVCYSISPLSGGFCTVPCAPFTRPCPTSIGGAECVGGPATAPLCIFLCDPKSPKCPNTKLSCQGPMTGDYYVCLP